MRKLLFEQFKNEITKTEKVNVECLVKVIDSILDEVNESNLELSIYDVKNNFDAIILNYEYYNSSEKVMNSLVEKYAGNKELFIKELSEFKGLLNGDDIKMTDGQQQNIIESNNDVESNTSFSTEGISKDKIELLNKIKECIGTELVTEDNLFNKLTKLNESNLLIEMLLRLDEMEIEEQCKELSVELDEYREFISKQLETKIGFKMITSEFTPDTLNIILNCDIKEDTESNIGFTDNIENNTPVNDVVVTNNQDTNQVLNDNIILGAINAWNNNVHVFDQQLRTMNNV